MVSTPIGNLGDVTLRALDVLREAGAILAEDTRRTRKLLSHHGIGNKQLIPYHDHNKERVTPGIVDRLVAGEELALVTDAGTPGISDPGFYVVRAALAAGVEVTAAPGANALLPALVLSGFPTDAFIFEGFPPRKKGELGRVVDALAHERRTVVFFVPPHRLVKVLDAFAERLPDRELAVARELTKLHEEVVRGNARAVLDRFSGKRVRGEIVLVVRGAGKKGAP